MSIIGEASVQTPPPPRAEQLPLPPGPKGLPLVGVAPMYFRDVYGYLPRLAREYGDVVRVPLPGMPMILLSHPDHVNYVMNRNLPRYPKGGRNAELSYGGPPALPTRDGANWKQVRQAVTPSFSDASLAVLHDLMVNDINERVQCWAADEADLDVQSEFKIVVLSVLLRVIFTERAAREDVQRLVDALSDYGRGMAWRMIMHGLPDRVPRRYARRGARAQTWLHRFLDEKVAERRAQPRDTTDLLGHLLTLEAEGRLPAEEVRSELMFFLIAGFETTATGLAWTIAQLGQHPADLSRAYEEVDALGGRPPSYDELRELTWLRACFDEALRLQGHPFYLRRASEDDEIGGYLIPQGSELVVSPYGMQRDPRFWREPERFRPARFLEDDIDKYAFIPFNVGPRRCIGMKLAYNEALVTLVAVLERYRFQLPDGFEAKHVFEQGTYVRGGVPVRLARR